MFKKSVCFLLITQLFCTNLYLCSQAIDGSKQESNDIKNFGNSHSKILLLIKRDAEEEDTTEPVDDNRVSTIPVINDELEPTIPEESNILTKATYPTEPTLPEENTIFKTTNKEPFIPNENNFERNFAYLKISNIENSRSKMLLRIKRDAEVEEDTTEPLDGVVELTTIPVKKVEEESKIPDESNILAKTTFHTEPTLPEENTIYKTTRIEPFIPNENNIEQNIAKFEPTIPDENQITLNKRVTDEPKFPDENTIGKLTPNRQTEETIPKELINQVNIIYKTTLKETSLPDESSINRIKREPNNEPTLPDDKLNKSRTTKIEPYIVTENINLRFRTTATEPTLPSEHKITARTTKTEPTLPHEHTRAISPHNINTEPKLPQEITTAIHTTITTTENNVTITHETNATLTVTPHSNLTSTNNETDSTNITSLSTRPTTDMNTTTTTVTTTSTSTATTLSSYYYALEECSRELCPNNSYCSVREFKCVCDEDNGYVKDDTFKGLVCKLRRPCDPSLKRCGRANCVEISKSGYRCECGVGYELYTYNREENDYFCKPIKCQYPLITGCVQKCKNNQTDYGFKFNNPEFSCDCYPGFNLTAKTYCVPDNRSKPVQCTADCKYGFCVNGRCECKSGFIFNGTNCEINYEWCTRNCDNKCKIDGNTNDVVCECDSQYKLNKTTGLCVSVSHCKPNEDGKLDCDKQNALCVQTDGKNSTQGYVCVCAVGTKKVGEKCVDICDIREYIEDCNNKNAICIYDMYAQKKFRCDCKPGFFRSNDTNQDSCLIAKHTLKSSLILRNPYLMKEPTNYYSENSNNDINVIYNSLNAEQKDNFIQGDLIKQLQRSLESAKINDFKGVSLIYCNPIDTFIKYQCEITFQMNGENVLDGNLKLQSVINDCSKPSNDNQYCYLPPKTIFAKTQFNAEVLQPCVDYNYCGEMSLYTECHKINLTTRFDCLCPKNTYRVYDVKFMGDPTGRQSRIEYCEDVNECVEGKKCGGEHQTCINTVGWYSCLCEDGYKNDTKVIDADCIPVCDGVDCNFHGQCMGKANSFWCLCDEGYSGVNCTLKGSNFIGIGFVISISVLSLVLLTVSLFAAYCIGRTKAQLTEASKVPANDYEVRPQFRRTSSVPEVPVRTVYRHRNVEQVYEEKEI